MHLVSFSPTQSIQSCVLLGQLVSLEMGKIVSEGKGEVQEAVNQFILSHWLDDLYASD